MPSNSNSTIVDVTYDDPRTGQRVRERRIQTIPIEEVDEVRDREVDAVRNDARARSVPRGRDDPRYYRDDDNFDEYVVRRRIVRERFPEHDRGGRRRGYPPESSGSSRSRSRSRRRHGHGRRRHSWSERRAERDVDTFFHKHFDTSYEGIFSATAGAAVGALAAQRLNRDKPHQDGLKQGSGGWKTLGGAVIGAAAANAAEHRYREYTEDKDDRRR